MMPFRVSFQATPEAKRNLVHYFKKFRGTDVIETHNGVFMTVSQTAEYEKIVLDILTASCWPGVRAFRINSTDT